MFHTALLLEGFTPTARNVAFPVAKSELLMWRLHDVSQGEIQIREINTIKQKERWFACTCRAAGQQPYLK